MKIFSWLLMFALYYFGGYFTGAYITEYIDQLLVTNNRLVLIVVFFIILLLVCFMQVIIHEAGHLIFGLLSGYKFNSFRIFNYMIVKDNNKLVLKRHSVAGTGGQCLMSPPDLIDGKIPYVLYNLGGSFFNFISSIICFILLQFMDTNLLSLFVFMFGFMGFIYGVVNGVPLRLGTVDNDGYNVVSISKDKYAIKSLWLQLKINELLSKGVRLKDMEDDWFVIPDDIDLKNSMSVVIPVFTVNRLMDQKDFIKAKEMINYLLNSDTGMIDLYRYLLICELIYINLIEDNLEEVNKLYNKKYIKFIKKMKTNPSVIRCEYTYNLLYKKDKAKCDKLMKLFEDVAIKYPHPIEIELERELLAITNSK